MTTQPDKEEFRRNLQEMHRLELIQADLFDEIMKMLTEPKHEKVRAACRQIYEDELRHAQELENLQALL